MATIVGLRGRERRGGRLLVVHGGSRRAAGAAEEGVVLPHIWTDEGVVAAPAANGGQMLHLSVALCA